MGFFKRLAQGLSKSRNGFVKDVDDVMNEPGKINDEFYDDLEETLILGDLGMETTEKVLDELRTRVKKNHVKARGECRVLLKEILKEEMALPEDAYAFTEEPSIVMLTGVNGVGKTTTVGKLAKKAKDQGKKVLISAADTFRAAAGDQLKIWADRANVPMIGGQDGADPASVVFDSLQSARSKQADLVLIDTAGRLHNKKNLMNELSKIGKVIEREAPDVRKETFLVLDATTGQNAIQQAKDFSEVTEITGIVLTKMDGTAKGGIAVAIASTLGIPVKYIGVGEQTDDLERFSPEEFVDALFDGEHAAPAEEQV